MAASIERSIMSFEINLDQQDAEKLKQCLRDIIRCENQICCRNALKMLEFEICPRVREFELLITFLSFFVLMILFSRIFVLQ
jgi:hypothetical protein